MKVYVTQGHEKGIGLEVFFKSCLLLSKKEIDQLTLLAFKESVKNTLAPLKLPFEIHKNHIEIAGISLRVEWLNKVEVSQSFTALELGMKLAESGGVLYTLPTSKDQFPVLGTQHIAGHTEYFRHAYHKSSLGMFFSSPPLNVLLLSDHVPVSQLSETLSEKVITEKLDEALKCLTQWHWPIKRVLISGFNPHAGEGGIIGTEDDRVKRAIKRLVSKHKYEMSGPLPGDTMLLEQSSKDDLLVYLFHDQGLGVFKGTQGFIGSNITLGLPYPRVSPDHGTSFSLFGKNQADYRGCAYSLREAISLLEKVSYGKNSSHQGSSS